MRHIIGDNNAIIRNMGKNMDRIETQSPSLPPKDRQICEPIGEVILGLVDPKMLNREQFNQSPDILFHGAGSDFIFSRNFVYEHFDNPGSHTIGAGFYTTDRRIEAEKYSKARRRRGEKTNVLELLPYKARMLDLRTKDNSKINAHVPPDFFQKYVKFIDQEFKAQWANYNPQEDVNFINTCARDGDFVEERAKRVKKLNSNQRDERYKSILKNLKQGEEPIYLRQMLSLEGSRRYSEYAAHTFSKFMKQDGFDGIIYIEGGDIKEQQNPVSFVFFNLDKIGTYDTWHTEVNK